MPCRRWIACLMCLCPALAFAQTKPTSGPASRPATSSPATSRPATSRPDRTAERQTQEALRLAINELTKEATDALAKKAEFPRGEPDYFKAKPAVFSQDELLKVLSRQLARDPRVDAYVKLQLLSAVEKFDVAHGKAAITAYVTGAPAVVPMPMSQKDIQSWELKRNNVKKAGDEVKVNDEYLAWRVPYEQANDIMFRCRDAMRDRIPVNDELAPKLLQARVEEMSQRSATGLDTWKAQTALFAEILTWARLAKKADIREMTAFATEYTKQPGPEILDKLVVSTRSTYWRKRNAGLDAKKLQTLIEKLKAAETNALQ